LRLLASALAASLLALAGFAPATASAAPIGPKVVIIVGATHGTTPTYRTYADAAYAEAIKYTSNVVKVYSPNATWPAVKAALQDASVVVYFGHGNGFPSPYRTSPWPYSQNGFGLNASAGNGDYNTQYYGEYYIANEVRLAPNAVVLLHHLCYAAGNSEPGKTPPTLSVAQQRVDNYAAGFLKAGARAVIADGHRGPGYYLGALFTSHQTIDQLWRSAPNFRGNVISFPSARSPGYTAQLDPETPTSGFYRALTGRLDLTTDEVTGAPFASSGSDPATLVVPGAASVTYSGAALFGDPGLTAPLTFLSPDTRLRVDLGMGVLGDGRQVVAVRALDGSSAGYVSTTDLIPRDSAGPGVWMLDAGSGALSPNGDGRSDTIALTGRFSEVVPWQVSWTDGWGSLLALSAGVGDQLIASWDGRANGLPVPDGTYRWRLTAADAWGNPELVRTGEVLVDTVAPVLNGFTLGAGPASFSPNGDGVADKLTIGFSTTERGYVDLGLMNAFGATVRSIAAPASVGSGSATWAGELDGGGVAPDGRYTLTISPRDAAGNVGAGQVATVVVYRSMRLLPASPAVFYPHDGDALGAQTTLGFALDAPAIVTWTITNAAGAVVETRYGDTLLGPGTYASAWTGRTADGSLLPTGVYYSVVRATDLADTTLTTSSRNAVFSTAFRIVVSDTTPARGRSITVTAITAEALAANPRLVVSQPGVTAWGVTMTKVSATGYRVTIRLKAGSVGTLKLKVTGTDLGAGTNTSTLALPLH
jgi:flagellar hook assembly protein FlgD